LKRLRDRRFSLNVEASHHHNGEFQPLAKYSEFAMVVADAGKPAKPAINGSPRVVERNGEPCVGVDKVSAAVEKKPAWNCRYASHLWLFSSLGAVGAIVTAVLVRALLMH
jgi:hypothetical protein